MSLSPVAGEIEPTAEVKVPMDTFDVRDENVTDVNVRTGGTVVDLAAPRSEGEIDGV